MTIERRWLIIPVNLINNINFDEVKENNPEALRLSVDGTKTFVKYDVRIVDETYTETHISAEDGEEIVTTINEGIYGRPSIYSSEYSEYNHEQILELLSGPEWTKPIEN
jgi:hypothetical protein